MNNQPYTDDSILLHGDFKFMALKRVPAKYLLKVYYIQNKRNKFRDQKLIEYIEKNLEKIIERKEAGDIVEGVELLCKKRVYMNEKEAKEEMRRIQGIDQDHKKPIRSYECEVCSFWHLTSVPYEEWKMKKNKIP